MAKYDKLIRSEHEAMRKHLLDLSEIYDDGGDLPLRWQTNGVSISETEPEAKPTPPKSRQPKLVIVVRLDIPVLPMGKYVVQGGHAGMEWILQTGTLSADNGFWSIDLTPAQLAWMQDEKHRKVALGIKSLKALEELKAKADAAKLPNFLITDLGLTVFSGPTVTCLAIGPAWDDEIDPITGHLRLL